MNFPAQSPHLRHRLLVALASWLNAHSPFPVLASHAVSVRRLAVSLSASFSAGLTTGPVPRLLHLAVCSGSLLPASPEDFHLLSTPMLGTLLEPLDFARGERFQPAPFMPSGVEARLQQAAKAVLESPAPEFAQHVQASKCLRHSSPCATVLQLRRPRPLRAAAPTATARRARE